MVYQLSTIVDEVIDLSKDSSLPRTRINKYVQRTHDRVLGRHRYRFNEKSDSSALTIGDLEYTPVTQYQVLHDVYLSHTDLPQPQKLCYVPRGDFFEQYPVPDIMPAGLPRFFTDYGGTFYFSSPADKAYTIAYRYQSAPKILSQDNSVPDIPEEFSDILVKGALARVEAWRENFDIAALYEREVEDLEGDLLARYGLRKLQPGKVAPLGARRRG